MYNAASQLLGIWCIDLSIYLIALLNTLNDILTSSLRFTSRIRKHWNKLLYDLTETTVYIFLIYTALGQNAYCPYCLPNVIIWTSESHVLVVCAR